MQTITRPNISTVPNLSKLVKQLSSEKVIGITYHHGNLIVGIDDSGDIVSAGNKVDSHTGYDIDDAKDHVAVLFNIIRDKEAHCCFPHTIDSVEYMFDSDNRSAIRMEASYSKAMDCIQDSIPFTENWIDKNNNLHTFDAPQFVALFESAMGHERALVFKCATIKAWLYAGVYSTVQEVLDLDAKQIWDDYVES